MNMRIYIYPWEPGQLHDKLFEHTGHMAPSESKWVWQVIRELCKSEGIFLHTADAISNASRDDVFVALSKILFRDSLWNHYSRLAYEKHIRRRILLQGEPPVTSPNMYVGVSRLRGLFSELYYCCMLRNTIFGGHLKNFLLNDGIESAKYFRLSATLDTILDSRFNRQPREFLVMINGNKFPVLPYKELYTLRIKAVNYFGYKDGFSLYGKGWNRRTFYPHKLDIHAVKMCYRGIIPSFDMKYDTLSKYNFSLCFENCRIEGYSTERLFDCFSVGTIPIYYGDPLIPQMVPSDCFIDFSKFRDFRLLEEYLLSLSEDDIEKYRYNMKRFMNSFAFNPFKVETFAKNFLQLIENGCWPQ